MSFKFDEHIRKDLHKLKSGKRKGSTYYKYVFLCKKDGCENEVKATRTMVSKLSGFCKKCSDLMKLDKAYKVKKETECKLKGKFTKIHYINCKTCNKLFIRNKDNVSKNAQIFCSGKCRSDYHNTNGVDLSIKRRYGVAKAACNRARNKNKYKKQMLLSFEEFKEVFADGKCSYCGNKIGRGGIGLDRLNNNEPYRKGNVTPCCGKCNRLRQDLLTPQETKEVLNLLKKLRGKENIWE